MQIRQVSVFLENKVGRVMEITEVLGENTINLRALSLADTSDFGILRMIVDKVDQAIDALKGRGFIVKETEVVAVEVPDKPGGLAQVLEILCIANINVEYMYAFFEQPKDKALLIFRFEDSERAIEVLGSKGIQIVDGSTLGIS
jgi:hypothetical protein